MSPAEAVIGARVEVSHLDQEHTAAEHRLDVGGSRAYTCASIHAPFRRIMAPLTSGSALGADPEGCVIRHSQCSMKVRRQAHLVLGTVANLLA